jgi:hypothetical protein
MMVAEKVYALISNSPTMASTNPTRFPTPFSPAKWPILKKHFPKEFYCAILDSDVAKRPQIQRHDERDQIDPSPFPSPTSTGANSASWSRGSSLRFPLSGIKGSKFACPFLLDERAKKGPFKDLFDFAGRMKTCGLNSLPSSASSTRAPSIRSMESEQLP